ncbi:MAG: hypothetical protein NZM12_01030, partial [Steroidobacteraceae bacterium]|nr:hypothetical protein [Steroidobacteraceae bacterium]
MTRNIAHLMRLAVVLSDLYLHADEAAGATAQAPDLSACLRIGTRMGRDVPWRAWLLARIGATARPTAADWLHAISPPIRQAWVATAVRCEAGLHHVRLPSDGCLELSDAETTALCASFATTFGTTPWQLRTGPAGGLVLLGQEAVPGVDPQEPARWLGRTLDPTVFTAATPALRRLSSEIELWLKDHPINRERRHRGAPPVTHLWFWNEPLGLSATSTERWPMDACGFGADPIVATAWRSSGRLWTDAAPRDFA